MENTAEENLQKLVEEIFLMKKGLTHPIMILILEISVIIVITKHLIKITISKFKKTCQ